MKERPILFSAPMVRAILEGRKTQTRRVIKPQFSPDVIEISEQPAIDPVLKCVVSGHSGIWEDGHGMDEVRRCPYGQPGDQLWVRETWRVDGLDRQGALRHGKAACGEEGPSFFADCECDPALVDGPWIPSIHMPRWASRIQLEITGVRVERLNDISEEDCIAEGIKDGCGEFEYYVPNVTGAERGESMESPREPYRQLWESINGVGSWAANPWVWVVEFRRVQK